jgi:hypothetical protein
LGHGPARPGYRAGGPAKLAGLGGLAEPKSGSLYEWRTKRIKLYATLWLLPADRTRENCVAIFSEIVTEMTQSAPAGLGSAGWYLQNAFQPEGHFWAGRFEDVGGKLLEVVELQIALSPPPQTSFGDGGPRVGCFARLDATPPEIQFGAGL